MLSKSTQELYDRLFELSHDAEPFFSARSLYNDHFNNGSWNTYFDSLDTLRKAKVSNTKTYLAALDDIHKCLTAYREYEQSDSEGVCPHCGSGSCEDEGFDFTQWSRKGKEKTDEFYRVVKEVIREAKGKAEGCRESAQTAHHMLPRSAGGTNEKSNLLPCCSSCSRWVHSFPAEAYRLGFTKKRYA